MGNGTRIQNRAERETLTAQAVRTGAFTFFRIATKRIFLCLFLGLIVIPRGTCQGTVSLVNNGATPASETVAPSKPFRPFPIDHGKHFDRVLIIVLENQNFLSAMKDKYLSDLAGKGALFTNFKGVAHPSYPNYLAMIAGSTFGVASDKQRQFKDDDQHRTIANLMEDWRNYAEDYPAKPDDLRPFLGSRGKYARKRVPFLSFIRVQQKSFRNVVSVDTRDTNNAFVSDISAFKRDSTRNALPRYMFYTPNLDDDGHDPVLSPSKGLKKASEWLQKFLDTWLKIDDRLKGTLVIVTFDESEGNDESNRIYTLFLGDMIKPGRIGTEYNHYSLLCTIEDNFGFSSLNTGDAQPTEANSTGCHVITEVWK